MSTKPRNRAGLDADAVARMMREQEDVAEVAAPEVDLPMPAENAPAPKPTPEAAPTKVESREAPIFDPGKVDGRTLRRTGREPFATRIKPETHAALKRIAYGRGITIAEALEISVAAFEQG